MLPDEICTLSAIVRCPSTIAAPPKVQRLPMFALPATPTQPAIAVCLPIWQLWPIWIWLSSLTPSSMTVSAKAPRSIGGVRADLDVVADDDAAGLRNLDPDAGLAGEAEAVAADDRTRMHDAARADDALAMEGDVREEMGVLADHASRPIKRPLLDDGAGSLITAPASTVTCGPMLALAATGRRIDRRRWMHAGLRGGFVQATKYCAARAK